MSAFPGKIGMPKINVDFDDNQRTITRKVMIACLCLLIMREQIGQWVGLKNEWGF